MFDWDDHSIYDLVALETEDEYARYMSITLTAFKALEQVYKIKIDRDDEAVEEAGIVLSFLKKLIYTFDTIRIKYRFNTQDDLKIDKSDSGFVNFYELVQIETDLVKDTSHIRLAEEEHYLKDKLLLSLLQKNDDKSSVLSQLAQKKYYLKLQKDRLFLLFNEGMLIVKDDSGENNRKYLYYWACYDKQSNMPFIYLLDFEQDIDSTPLHEDDVQWQRFLKVIKSEGSRAPAAGIVAMAIDQRLDNIHPKMLKRICLGPIYSKAFSVNLNKDVNDLLTIGDEGRKFVFHVTEQFVFSVGQNIITDPERLGKIAEKRRVREKFFIPNPSDIEDYTTYNELDSQKASFIRKSVVMPYKLHQHLTGMYKGYRIISFSRSGNINGI